MKIKQVSVGPLETNCYILFDENTKNAIIIDPGDSYEKIAQAIDSLSLTPKIIINTHGHADHIGANNQIKDKYNCEIYIHSLDANALVDPEENMSLFLGNPISSYSANKKLNEDDEIILDGISLKVIHTPGHTEGSICLLGENEIFTGDTLFNLSVGRTDLPGGDIEDLKKSLNKLKQLPPALKVYSGHGEESSLEYEIKHNPYLRKNAQWF